MTAHTLRRFLILLALGSVPALTGVANQCDSGATGVLNEGQPNETAPVSTGEGESDEGLLNATLVLEGSTEEATVVGTPADATAILNGAHEEQAAASTGEVVAPAGSLLNEDLIQARKAE